MDNMVQTLDITTPTRQFRIPTVWTGKKSFLEEVRETSVRRIVAYRKTTL